MAESTKKADDLATKRADRLAEHQLDPAAAAQAAALAPEPVYYIEDQALTNPGVQGFVFRPHQEKNPGADQPGLAKDRDALSAKIRLEKDARDRRGQALREAAQKRGETVVEPGPARLRMHVDISAHSVVDEAKLGAVAAAADALVAAIRDAGVDPKADVSGVPF